MPLKGLCLYYALLGLMQTTTSVVVMILKTKSWILNSGLGAHQPQLLRVGTHALQAELRDLL